MPSSPAAARGPGVGGTYTWVASRPPGKADSQHCQRDPGFSVDGLDQGGQDYTGSIGKYRDGDQIAGKGHGQAGPFLPYQADGINGHPVGPFGGIQIVAQQDPKNDYDPDAFYRTRKPAGNGFHRTRSTQSGQDPHDQGRGQQSNECIGLDFQAQKQQDGNPYDKDQFNWHFFLSPFSDFRVFLWKFRTFQTKLIPIRTNAPRRRICSCVIYLSPTSALILANRCRIKGLMPPASRIFRAWSPSFSQG